MPSSTSCTLASLRDRLTDTPSVSRLQAHLTDTYSTSPQSISTLDIGVFRVDWPDGTVWVARTFPSDRPLEAAQADASVLRVLQDAGYPAERCAHEHAVSVCEVWKVLVTQFLDGPKARPGPKTLYRLGVMLGRLNKMDVSRSIGVAHAGSWHHMSPDGGPQDDIALAKRLIVESKVQLADDQKKLCDTLLDELDGGEAGQGLPTAFIHPDFVPFNVIVPPAGGLVVIDWAGAGIGPRILGLGFLLFAAGARDLARVDDVLKGYSSQVTLQQVEIDRLAGAAQLRPLIIACWEYLTGRKSLETTLEGLPGLRSLCKAIGERAKIVLYELMESSMADGTTIERELPGKSAAPNASDSQIPAEHGGTSNEG